MERRRAITPEPSQAKYLAKQEKIAPQIKKRNDELLRALDVVVADENTDIEATIKKYAKKKK